MFVIRSCCHLVSSQCADGREVHNECGNSVNDKKCYEVKDCPFRQVADKLIQVTQENLCSSCDGIGYADGCTDNRCGTHTAYECLKVLDLEFIEDTEPGNLADNKNIC